MPNLELMFQDEFENKFSGHSNNAQFETKVSGYKYTQ